MSIKSIMKIPYVMFVLGMLDAPQINYDSKKEEISTPKTAEDEAAAIVSALG